MGTETKMNYDLFGSLIMLKASLGVVLDRLEGDEGSLLWEQCDTLRADIEDVLKTDWHWG